MNFIRKIIDSLYNRLYWWMLFGFVLSIIWFLPIGGFHHDALLGIFGGIIVIGEDPTPGSIFYIGGVEIIPTPTMLLNILVSVPLGIWFVRSVVLVPVPEERRWRFRFTMKGLFVFVFSLAGVFAIPYLFRLDTGFQLTVFAGVLAGYTLAVIYLNRRRGMFMLYLLLYGICFFVPESLLEERYYNSGYYVYPPDFAKINAALEAYHADYGVYPPRVVCDETGKPLYSWRVLLLPYLNERVAHANFYLNRSWDSTWNSPLLDKRWGDSFSQRRERPGFTSILYVVRDDSPEAGRTVMPQSKDSFPHFIYCDECEIYWTEPRDFHWPSTVPFEKNSRPIDSHFLLKHSLLPIEVSMEEECAPPLSSRLKGRLYRQFVEQGLIGRKDPLSEK